MAESKVKGNTGDEGRLYELELLVLFFQKAHLKTMDHPEAMEFQLGREVKSAGKFDDLVFRYKDEEGFHVRYLQAKHCLREDDKITSNDLFPPQHKTGKNLAEKFHLDKYLISFLSIKRQHETDPKMGKLKDLVIFTNVDFDYDELREKNIETTDITDDFIDFSTPGSDKEGRLLKLQIDADNELCSKLRDCSEYFVLATEIINQVKEASENPENPEKRKYYLGVPDSPSEKYAEALFSKVIEKSEDNRIKFRKGFLLGGAEISENARIFRAKLLDIAKRDHDFMEEEFRNKAAEIDLVGTKKFQDRKKGLSDLPTEEITNEDIKKFFGNLVFAVNQPNADQLRNCIADKELKAFFGSINTDFIFTALENEILKWINQKKSKEGWIDSTKAKEFFQGIKKMFDSVIVMNHSRNFVDSFLKVSDTGGNLSAVEEFLKRDASDSKFCLQVKSKEPFLTCCKLYKIIKDNIEPNNEESAIFVNSTMLQRTEEREKILEGFRWTNSNVLVVECTDMPVDDKLNNLIDKTKETNQKLILVTAPNGNFSCDPKYLYQQVEDNAFSFGQLTQESRDEISEKKVEFQGEPVQLKDIIDIKDSIAVERILNGRTIVRLIRDQEITKMGTPIPKLKNSEEQIYIERVFLVRHEIEISCPKEIATKEVKKEKLRENKLMVSDERLIIISDSAGMGKSTVLTSLSIRLKREWPKKYVIRVNLKDHASTLLKHKGQKIASREESVKFFREVFLEPKQHDLKQRHGTWTDKEEHVKEDLLESELYNYYLEKREEDMVIFLDGLDEICPDYTSSVLSLIKVLYQHTKIGKLVVATRPNMKTDLIFTPNTPTYALEHFTAEEQVDFLTNFWQNRNSRLTDSSRVQKYAERLIKMLNQCINDWERKLTGIPLQTAMVAEIFEKHQVDGSDLYGDHPEGVKTIECSLEEYYDSDASEPTIPDHFDLSTLYDLFVEKKFWDILVSDKRKIDCSIPDIRDIFKKEYVEFQKDYQLLAVFTLFPEKYDELLDASLKERIKKVLKEINTGKDKNGLVNEIVDGKPQFLHRTFVEYFFVELLADYLLSQNEEEEGRRLPEAQDIFIKGYNKRKFDALLFKEVLMKFDYVTIREFLERKLGTIITSIKLKRDEDFLQNIGYRLALALDSSVLEAMKANQSNIITFLVNCFGDLIKHVINYKDNLVKEAIEYAASNGNLDMVKWCVQKGVEIKKIKRLLHAAAEYRRSSEVVDYLLHKYKKEDGLLPNIIINGYNDLKETPLHIAARTGNLNAVKSLITCGANFYARARHCNYTPFDIAVKYGNLETVEYFIERGYNIHTETNSGEQALHFACGREINADTAKFLLECKADIEKKDKNGRTPLHSAAYEGNLDVAKVLIDHGADIHARTIYGYTPWLWALGVAKFEFSKYLISIGSNLNDETNEGWRGLHLASSKGSCELVEFFLEKGADINKTDKNDRTPLHFAVRWGNLDTVKVLIRRGADIHAKTKDGYTPLLFTLEGRNFDFSKYLIFVGSNINDETNDGMQALHLASQKGHCELVEFFLVIGADIKKKDKEGQTALHIAALWGNLDVAVVLVQNGADIHARTKHDYTPLQLALQRRHSRGGPLSRYGELSNYLRSVGSDIQ